MSVEDIVCHGGGIWFIERRHVRLSS
jgi:hypothetical protein